MKIISINSDKKESNERLVCYEMYFRRIVNIPFLIPLIVTLPSFYLYYFSESIFRVFLCYCGLHISFYQNYFICIETNKAEHLLYIFNLIKTLANQYIQSYVLGLFSNNLVYICPIFLSVCLDKTPMSYMSKIICN